MLHLIVLTLALCARAETVVPEFSQERLFRLESGGHVSHLLVTGAFALDPAHRDVVAAFAALDNSCEVFLMGKSTFEQEPAPAAKVNLVDHLTPAARETLRELGLNHLLESSVSIASAWYTARVAFYGLRARRAEEYFNKVAREDRMDLDFEINPDLHLASEMLFGEKFSDIELLNRAGEWGMMLVEAEADENFVTPSRVDVQQTAVLHADYNKIRVTHLDQLTPAPATPANLEQFLMALRPLIRDERPLDVYVEALVANYLESELADRFFELDPQKFAMLQATLTYSGACEHSVWPGEQPLVRHDANAHEHWVGALTTALAKGRTFVALDAKYVLPHVAPDRRRSLLDLLAEKGVKVTPISARRHKIGLVE